MEIYWKWLEIVTNVIATTARKGGINDYDKHANKFLSACFYY